MQPEERDLGLLWDMLDHAREVVSFVAARTFDDYIADVALRRAVERSVQIVGEAACRVSRQFCDAHPQIPWRAISAQRHILVHEYDQVQDDKIWRVATVYIPQLIELLTPLVPPAPPDPSAPG